MRGEQHNQRSKPYTSQAGRRSLTAAPFGGITEKQVMRILVLLLVLLCGSVFTQEAAHAQTSIRGRTLSIFDSTAVMGTDVLLVRGDSILSGTSSDVEGAFTLDAVPSGDYLLRARNLGFEPTDTPVSVSGTRPLRVDLYVGRIIPDDELMFGAAEARRDIAAGKVELLEFAMIDMTHFYVPDSCYEQVRGLFDERIAEIDRLYGYAMRDITEEYRDRDWFVVRASVEKYNEEVWRHLNARNGEGWAERIRAEALEAKREAIIEGCPY